MVDRYRVYDCVVVAAVADSVVSKVSGDVPYLQAYGHDITLPMAGYFANLPLDGVTPTKYANAAAILALASLGEIAQKVGLYGGEYDVNDFGAYALGVTAAIGLHTLIERYVAE